ncbi:hypothetical protein BvCmsSIP078_01874 [Escherichia coli]|nr:hypothetical protein BvCmsSIP078_01874 [Escherichia coli]
MDAFNVNKDHKAQAASMITAIINTRKETAIIQIPKNELFIIVFASFELLFS